MVIKISLKAVSDIFEKFKLIERKKKTAIMLPTIDIIKKLKADLEISYEELKLELSLERFQKINVLRN